MRYQPIASKLFEENRRRFAAQLPPDALCIIHSNDVIQTNADGTCSFVQNSDLFWLTGIDQEETILIFFPDSSSEQRREVLFIRKTDAHTAIWEGNKLRRDEATALSGIRHVHWTSAFEGILKRVMAETSEVFLCVNQHPGRISGPQNQNHRWALWCRNAYPVHNYHNADPILGNLRMIKSELEVAQIRRACEITRHGFLRACRNVQPGIFEYQLEADFAHAFISHGSSGFAYEPIIASGANSCILHYTANDSTCENGQVVLMDVGARYANYCADITRTLPVNGRFSVRQRAVYDGVLEIYKKAERLMVPGVLLSEYHEQVSRFADDVLVDLGLMSPDEYSDPETRKGVRDRYFLHRTAHYLGLDVHDAGDPNAQLVPGMVLTCEPGIYIREEELGIRLENDLLITDSGNENLMSGIPLEASAIEALISAE